MKLSSGGLNIYSGFLKDKPQYSKQRVRMPDWDLTPFTVHVNHDFVVVVLLASYSPKKKMNVFPFGSKFMTLSFLVCYKYGLMISQGGKILGKDGL